MCLRYPPLYFYSSTNLTQKRIMANVLCGMDTAIINSFRQDAFFLRRGNLPRRPIGGGGGWSVGGVWPIGSEVVVGGWSVSPSGASDWPTTWGLSGCTQRHQTSRQKLNIFSLWKPKRRLLLPGEFIEPPAVHGVGRVSGRGLRVESKESAASSTRAEAW